MKYTITPIECGAYVENAYLLCPEGTGDGYLIDPGDNILRLHDEIIKAGCMLRGVMLTHGHFDHMLSAQPLNQLTGAPVYIHAEDLEMLSDAQKCSYNADVSEMRCPDMREAEIYSDVLDLGGMHFEILHTPGHTKGSVCLYDAENGNLFSGDTLFCAGFGRTDLYGGSMHMLRDSLRRLFALPDETRVFPGHGETTTIGQEKRRYGL